MGEDGMELVDNVETNWRGVQDLGIHGNECEQNEVLMGVTINSGNLSVYGTKFKHMRLDPDQEEIRPIRSHSAVTKKKPTEVHNAVSIPSISKQISPVLAKEIKSNQGYPSNISKKPVEDKLPDINIKPSQYDIKPSKSENCNEYKMIEELSKGRLNDKQPGNSIFY